MCRAADRTRKGENIKMNMLFNTEHGAFDKDLIKLFEPNECSRSEAQKKRYPIAHFIVFMYWRHAAKSLNIHSMLFELCYEIWLRAHNERSV